MSANPLSGNGTPLTIESSQYVKARTSSDSTWFIGQFKKGFAYMENWPITVEKAPANSEAEFMQDIVARWKVSERGAAACLDPRYAVKCTA
jgi:streptogramin lyase